MSKRPSSTPVVDCIAKRTLVQLVGIDKRGGESWGWGGPVYVDPEHVIGIEQKEHRYHSFRPEQTYTVIHLSTGAVVEVMADAKSVQEKLDAAGSAA